MEEEKRSSFKVEDRRRFSAEGELKPEHRGEESARAESAPPPPPAPKPSPTVRNEGAQREADRGGEMTFASFMVGLSTQALVMLGEITDPQDASGPNLPAAQQLIDIIGMLQEKTRGNLDQAEQDLIEGILFELRMKYVEHARRK